jgi:hypothetical protein
MNNQLRQSTIDVLFYADDGMITGEDATELQYLHTQESLQLSV